MIGDASSHGNKMKGRLLRSDEVRHMTMEKPSRRERLRLDTAKKEEQHQQQATEEQAQTERLQAL
jgi:hypothetical protein